MYYLIMAPTSCCCFFFWCTILLLPSLLLLPFSTASPAPAPWPLQFHSLLFINSSTGTLQATDLWYDWPNGRNFNIIHHQLANVLHDLEWTNGTSFFYDLDAKTCSTSHFEVGILRPDWMDGATYLGQEEVDGFTCNVWTKADFIVYWEDVETNRPVHWVFYTGMSAHVMTFEVGAVLEDIHWQAPSYCFSEEGNEDPAGALARGNVEEPLRRWLHGFESSIQSGSSEI